MDRYDKARTTRALNHIRRCKGCGGWRFHYADLRPCTTCQVLAKRRDIERLLGVGA
jgi:hypothetical protein